MKCQLFIKTKIGTGFRHANIVFILLINFKMSTRISCSVSISKIFNPNFVCLLTNERYKTYQTGFSFGRLGHAPGMGLGGTEKFFFPKFNQIWCVSYLHEWHMQRHHFCFLPPRGYCNRLRPSGALSGDEIQPNLVCVLLRAPPPGALERGQKVKCHIISLNFNY